VRQVKLARSSRWKSGPGKAVAGRLAASVARAVGDGGREAYTAVMWGVGMSHERHNNVGPRLLVWSKATCAAPLREVLTPYRGRWPHHARKDRIGTWEIPRLTSGGAALVRIGKARSRSR
jgi:hypothetical protein